MVTSKISKRWLLLVTILCCLNISILYAEEDKYNLKGMDLLAVGAGDLECNTVFLSLHRMWPYYTDLAGKQSGVGTVAGGERIYVFGNGYVYSERYYSEKIPEDYYIGGCTNDDKWRFESGSRSYIRTCKYYLEPISVLEILQVLGKNNGVLCPGKHIPGHHSNMSVKVIYGDSEGILFEALGAEEQNMETTAIMEEVLNYLSDIECEVDMEVIAGAQWYMEVDEKKEEMGIITY